MQNISYLEYLRIDFFHVQVFRAIPTISDLYNSLTDPTMIQFQYDRFILVYEVAAPIFLYDIIYNYKNDKQLFFQIPRAVVIIRI